MRPAVFGCLKQYSREKFVKDLTAGAIVGIIALPLSIAMGIASGVSPEKGLITAIVGGFLISLLGGCNVQIGGPSGTFVVIVAGVVSRHGIEGLLLATLMAGIILILAGLLRFGKLLQFIPYPVVAGFTSGIAIVIFSTQVGDFLGLATEAVPAEFLLRWSAYLRAIGTVSWQTLLLGAFTLTVIILWPRLNRRIPATLVALLAATFLTLFLPQVETIGSRFKSLSATFPAPLLPVWSITKAVELFPTALTIAFLVGIESLFSAVVADGMTDTRHDPNMELVAQGIANIGSALFGGIPVTGALARTAANIKNGGRSPISGMVHSIALLLILLVGMPYVKHVPMTALAAVLIIVSYNMGEWTYFKQMKRLPKSDCAVFLTAFVLTLILDLVMAIGIALVLAAILVLIRLKNLVGLHAEFVQNGVMRMRVNGPLFFMAAQKLRELPKSEQAELSILQLDLQDVPFMDASALKALVTLKESANKQGIILQLENLQKQPHMLLARNGFELA